MDTYVMSNNSFSNMKKMLQMKNKSMKCICYRPHSKIICNNCGFWTKGRVRHCCPQHPQMIFLYDYVTCPRCKSYNFMLTEI